MKTSLTSLALIAAFSFSAFPQPPEQTAKIDSLFAQWNKPDSPGCAVSVVRDGMVVHNKGYGMANLEYSVPFTPDTISETGSVAKQFTAAAVLLLSRRGKLSLDDPARKHIPELPEFMKGITVRHLISHLSGLRDQNELFSIMGLPMGRSVHTNDEILELVTKQQRLNFEPGSEYNYNNTAYTLLAHIVTRVSGEPFAEFTRKNIFEKLGMKSTKWRNDFRETVKGRASAYEAGANGVFKLEMPFGNVHGAGGLLTTVGDLQIWNRSLDEGTLDGIDMSKLIETRAKLNDGTAIPYALGVQYGAYRGVEEIAHAGSTAGYRTYLARYPSEKLSVALLCNVTNITTATVAREVARAFFMTPYKDNRLTPTPVPVEQLQKLAGYYYDEKSGEIIEFTEKGGRFLVGLGAGTAYNAMSASRFVSPDTVTSYTFEGTDKVTRRFNVFPATTFTKLSGTAPSGDALNAFAGHYISAELDTTYVLTVKDGKLSVRIAPQAPMTLTPIAPDIFLLGEGGANYRFIRDAKGQVTGLVIYTGRVRHLMLKKV